jgi:3-oxoadipate enol-lactonase
MTTVTREGVDLYYETAGTGETVAFVGDAGFGAWQWGHQYEAVAGPREALVWDLPGTGRSDAPAGPCDVDTLAADLEAVLGAAEAARAHVVGAGLGGMVALQYAREYGRARSLALFGTAADGGAVDEAALRALHPDLADETAVRESLSGAFSAEYLERAVGIDRIVEWRRGADARGDALAAQFDAMCGFEAEPLHEVTLPALVFHGDDDPVVPPAAGEQLAEALPGGEFVPVAGRHLAHVESAPAVTDRLVGFLDRVDDER